MRRGTGLGMPLVKSLVQQMSGEITVESAVGKGNRFTVTLPLEVGESMTIR
nr:ATP-binding protein [Fournierella massiliensis]